MNVLDLASNPISVNIVLFALGAAVVWFAGSKLENYAVTISSQYGLGSMFAGMVLLAGATSLPEMATTVTASLNNNGPLALNNLMGGVAMQIAILALADWRLAGGRLTYFTPDFSLLMQGVSLILLLGVVIVAMAAGEVFSVAGVGGWSALLIILYFVLLYQIYRIHGNPRWHPGRVDHDTLDELEGSVSQLDSRSEEGAENGRDTSAKKRPGEEEVSNTSVRMVVLLFALFSLVVLAAGWLVSEIADTLTHQMQLSASFVGAVFLAVATSLPEISTTIAAVKDHNYSTAISNVFGTNMIEVALVFLADLFYRSGPILVHGGRQTMFMAGLGLVLTGVYLWGLLERGEKTFWRIGIDSAIVLVVYLAGIAILYTLG